KPSYQDLLRTCKSCAEVAAWRSDSASLAGGDRPGRVQATYATQTLLPLLGVRPMLGRSFDAGEGRPGDPQVGVLRYDLWQRVFAGDRDIVGRQIHLDAMPVTVVGVMPRGFYFPEREEAFVPLRLDFTKDEGGSFNLSVIVRLAPGATIAQLDGELAA